MGVDDRYRSITVNLTPAQYTQLSEEASAKMTSISQLLRVWLQARLALLPAPQRTPQRQKERGTA